MPTLGAVELKCRLSIGPEDFERKTRYVLRALGQGRSVMVSVLLRGQETSHPELWTRLLERIAERVEGVGRVERLGTLDGHTVRMLLAPTSTPPPSSPDDGDPE